MPTADRKSRNQRTTALTFGFMSEVGLGGVLLIWSGGSPAPLGREVLGPAASFAVVTAAMVLLAGGMLALVLASRLGRSVLRGAVVAVALVVGGLGAVAVTALFQDPGIGILLGFSWVLTIPVILEITRASALSGHKKR